MSLELSACVEMMFGGRPFSDRLAECARAGVPLVEFWRWRDKDLDALAAALAETGVGVTSFLADPGGHLVDPGTHRAFMAGLVESCAVARRLGCPNVVVLSGDEMPDVARERQRDALVDALRSAGPIAADHGVTVLLEPLNTLVDHPGHFLSGTAEGFDVVRRVDHPAVRLLYDLYHSVVMGETPREVLANAIELVGHVQVADAPGRHQPGTGAVDWAEQVDVLVAAGYQGALGLEYEPVGDTGASLAHLRDVLASRR